MKNILFNVELLDRHYAFYLDDETNNLYGFAVKRNNKAYFITKGNEISFMNKIIDFLNEKYIRRNDVLYKNEYLERYINRYNKMSYFARKNEDEVIPVPYEEAPDLYDFYNKPKTLYIGRKRNAGRQGSYRGYGDVDPFSTSSPYGQYNPYGSNGHFSPSDPYYNNQYQNRRNRNKKPPLKLIFAIAGAVGTISVSAIGAKFFIDGGKVPFITKSQIEQQFGEVDITAACGTDNFKLVVQDTGIGIDEKYHGKIFAKFVQLDSAYTKKESSTGLGLTITKELVELHGGKISLISEVNNGSTFIVEIPQG